MEYNTVTVREICNYITSGGTPSSTVENYYVPAQIPWLKTKEVNYFRIYETENYISRDGLEHSNAKLIPENSVIVAMYGQGDTAGRVAINKIPLTTNQACCNLIIDAQKADYNYVYYALSGMYEKLVSLKNGGAQPNLNAKIIGNIKIGLPDITVQHRIADILSAYDNLIENNRRQIKLLEEAAQRLYKEWFVDLRFPGWEMTEIVDGVPEGWEKASVGDILKKVPRTKQIRTADYLQDGNIPVIDQSRNFIAGYTNDMEAMIVPDEPIIVFGDHTRILKLISFSFAKGADGTQLVISGERRMPQRLLYCSLVNIDLSNYHYARHFKYLKAEEIFVPTFNIAKVFEQIATGFFSKIDICREQIAKASQARDRLLPKLMSGELEV